MCLVDRRLASVWRYRCKTSTSPPSNWLSVSTTTNGPSGSLGKTASSWRACITSGRLAAGRSCSCGPPSNATWPLGPKSARSESRWRTAGHAMSSVRLLKRKGTLFFDFRVRGVRCREYTALADSEANRKRLKKVLDRIEAEIASGTFDYRRFFPESNLASQFDVPMATATSALDKAMPETALFRDFADKWYVQHE